jgi:phosphatidylglycerophosphate synthase
MTAGGDSGGRRPSPDLSLALISAICPLPLPPTPAAAAVSTSLIILFSGVFVPVSQMGGWLWMYYTDALAHVTRMVSLSVFYCDAAAPGNDCQMVTVSAGGAPVTVSVYEYVSGTLLSMTYDRRWQALGWALFIIAVLRTWSILAYARINHTKR